MAIQLIKTIPAGKAIPVKTTGVKNADVYDIIFSESGSSFKFAPNEGKLVSKAESKNNFTITENGELNFIPAQTYYFGVEEKSTKRMTKAEVDAYQAAQAAKVLNSAADAALKSEQVKQYNTKRIIFAAVGITLLISGIAAAFYYSNRQCKATG